MPGFIKTPSDEKKWSHAKTAAAKQTKEGSEGYWKLSNYIFHKMNKTEESQKLAKELEKSLTSVPSTTIGTSVPSGTKMPKPKAMPKISDKPSVFFKKSEFSNIKKPSIENLRLFLEKSRSKSNL